MRYRLVILVGLLCACRFDDGGLPGSGVGDARTTVDAPPPDAPPDATPPDAPPPDAPVPCTDRDGDGFLAVAIPGSDCGAPLDCDDDDPRAYPGQTDFYDEPSASGGFDFDCNGVEQPLYPEVGGACERDWWGGCHGTGWYNGVPACGAEAMWHACANQDGECVVTADLMRRMPCR